MSEQSPNQAYRCPRCGGGFPELDDGCCPWCGVSASGSYEPPEPPYEISKTVKDNGEESRGLIAKMLMGEG